MRRLRFAPGAALLAAALAASPALGQPALAAERESHEAKRAVVVILCAYDDPFGQRLAAELASLGLRAVIEPPDVSRTRTSLEASARRAQAIAAVRATAAPGGVELWIADRATGKTVLRELQRGEGPDGPARLALHTAELLRASLLEITLPTPPPDEGELTADHRAKAPLPSSRRPSVAAPAPPPRDREQPEPIQLRFSVAPGALLSPGGLGASAALDLGVAWMASDRLGVAAFAAIPLSEGPAEEGESRAELAVVLAGGAARILFTPRQSRWAPSLDLGVAGLWLSASGESQTLRARDSSAATAAPFARVGLAFAATPSFRARADLLVGAVLQSISLELGGAEAAIWGQPFVLPTLGIDMGWF